MCLLPQQLVFKNFRHSGANGVLNRHPQQKASLAGKAVLERSFLGVLPSLSFSRCGGIHGGGCGSSLCTGASSSSLFVLEVYCGGGSSSGSFFSCGDSSYSFSSPAVGVEVVLSFSYCVGFQDSGDCGGGIGVGGW